MTLLLIYLGIAIGLSFLCSILESVLLSVPRSHVAVLEERGVRAGVVLRGMKDDIDRPLAAILTLNTFAHTLGAAGVGAEAARIWGEAWVGLVSVVVTILILIFSEIIPKTLGAVHAKGLAPPAAHTTRFLIVTLKPVVAVCDGISKLLSRSAQSTPGYSRDEVRSIASMARDEGTIEHDESELIHNMIALRETRVGTVMTPRMVVATLGADATVGDVMGGDIPAFSRMPLVTESLDDARRFVHRHALLRAISEGRTGATLDEISRPLRIVPESATLIDAMRAFTKSREHISLVVDEHGGGVGIVTLEDIMESLLGVEIVDETDSAIDMRQLARSLAERRGES